MKREDTRTDGMMHPETSAYLCAFPERLHNKVASFSQNLRFGFGHLYTPATSPTTSAQRESPPMCHIHITERRHLARSLPFDDTPQVEVASVFTLLRR
jgi:hypothetical protein